MLKNEININDILYEEILQQGSSLGLSGYNNTHYFLLPLFGSKLPLIYNKYYVGSFLGDYGRVSNLEHCIYVIFKFKNFEDHMVKTITDSFENNSRFKYSYYAGHNEGELICYVLKTSPEDVECFNTIVEGKYSKISKQHLVKIMSYHFNSDTKKRIQGICNKEEWHKRELESLLDISIDGSELWQSFEESQEIFRYHERVN